MHRRFPIASMAGCFALSGFAIAIVSGLLTSNAASSILSNALFALVSCYIIGLIVGLGAKAILGEHLSDYARTHPVPRLEQAGIPSTEVLQITPDPVEPEQEVTPEGVAA